MDHYKVPRDLFLRAFAALDGMPASHVRPLLNEMEACARDNESTAAQAERAKLEADIREQLRVQTSAQDGVSGATPA